MLDSVKDRILTFFIHLFGLEELIINTITEYCLFIYLDGVFYPVTDIVLDKNIDELVVSYKKGE